MGGVGHTRQSYPAPVALAHAPAHTTLPRTTPELSVAQAPPGRRQCLAAVKAAGCHAHCLDAPLLLPVVLQHSCRKRKLRDTCPATTAPGADADTQRQGGPLNKQKSNFRAGPLAQNNINSSSAHLVQAVQNLAGDAHLRLQVVQVLLPWQGRRRTVGGAQDCGSLLHALSLPCTAQCSGPRQAQQSGSRAARISFRSRQQTCIGATHRGRRC